MPSDSTDEPMLEEQGQECLLLEDLPVKNSQAENNEAEVPKKKSSRKVQQVLLVPTNGELLMERYRQAGQRAVKARALLDEALNWDVCVTDRDRMASDAFLEAGKARLLVEVEKTPELVAMLADAKAKGEEEACRAADYKVKKLIPDVSLPSKAGVKVPEPVAYDKSPAKSNQQLVESDGISMKHDHRMQCFQNMFDPHVTAKSGDLDNDDDGNDDDDSSSFYDDEAAEEHAFRARQYLEFILPELGDERDDSSMAPKAVNNPRNILQAYRQQLGLTGSGDATNLQNLSSLGFDESHSYDIVSSEDTSENDEDTFSMSSLNEIMEAPVDDFQPDKILSMPSQLRHRLTVRMSFGGKSMRQKRSKEEPYKVEESNTPEESVAQASEAAIAEDITVLETPSTAFTKEKTPNSRMFPKRSRRQSTAELPSVPEEHGGFLSRFRSLKKRPTFKRNAHDEKDNTITSRIITPILSDLSDNQSKLNQEPVSSHMIAPVLSELTDVASAPPRKDDGSLRTEDTIAEEDVGVEVSSKASTTDKVGREESSVADESIDGEDAALVVSDKPNEGHEQPSIGTENLALIPSTSIGSSAALLDDRYTVAGIVEDEEDDIMLFEERYSVLCDDSMSHRVPDGIEPLSPASVDLGTKHGRYSPVTVNSKEAYPPEPVVLEKDLSDTENNSVTSMKENNQVNPDDQIDEDNIVVGQNKDSKKEKRKRRSLIGLFRKDNIHSESPKEEMAGPKTDDSRNEKTTSKPSVSKNEKKPSSLQTSLKKSTDRDKLRDCAKFHQRSSSGSPSKVNKEQNGSGVLPNRNTTQQKKIGLSKKHHARRGKPASSLKRAIQESTADQASNHRSNASNTKPQSSLKTALELSQDTVEVMTMDTIGAAPSSVSPELAQEKSKSISHKNSKQKKPKENAKGARKTGKSGKKPQKKGKSNNPQSSQQKKKAPTKSTSECKLSTTPQKMGKASKKAAQNKADTEKAANHSWVNPFSFHKKKKESEICTEKKPMLSVDKKHDEVAIASAGLSQLSPKILPEPTPPVIEEAETKKLSSDTASTMKSSSDLSVATATNPNPLLPFQLLKQLEEDQSCNGDVKDAAERSIVQSHAKYRSAAHNTRAGGEKENDITSLASLGGGSTWTTQDKSFHTAPVTGSQMSLPSQSPRVLCTSNTDLAKSTDPDGLNARAKDVREVYGLAPIESLGEERSRSFLSRITHGTYRQDHDLPDP